MLQLMLTKLIPSKVFSFLFLIRNVKFLPKGPPHVFLLPDPHR